MIITSFSQLVIYYRFITNNVKYESNHSSVFVHLIVTQNDE